MSKEGKFHKLIEDLDKEEKSRVWSAIKEQEELQQASNETVFVKKARDRTFARKIAAVTISFIIVVGGGVFIAMKLLPSASIQAGSSEDISSGNEGRYYDSNSYSVIETDKTLKYLANYEEKAFLYLDWYDVTDYYSDGIYQLKESAEIVGYREGIVDVNTGSLVNIRILLSDYQLQGLEVFQTTDSVDYVNNVQIEWKTTEDMSYAKFRHGEYDYYITLEYPMEPDSILGIIQELLN